MELEPVPVCVCVNLHLCLCIFWCQKCDLSIQCCSDGTVQLQNMVIWLWIRHSSSRLEVPSLEYRRLRSDVIEVYKILNQLDRVSINKFFTVMDETTTH